MPASHRYSKPEVLTKIVPLGLRAHRVVEGAIVGLHRSPLHGVSPEFADHRPYAPGDDLKRLDWRAYARNDRHVVKRFEEESNLRATLVVDCSGSMAYGESGQVDKWPSGQVKSKELAESAHRATSTSSKFDFAALVAASLATLLIRQRDAVGLALVDQSPRVLLQPSAKTAQLARIHELLESASPDRSTDLGAALEIVADQTHRRGLIVVLSDLLCDEASLFRGLGKLQFRGHEVVVLQVLHSHEMDLPFNDAVLFKDIEGQEEVMAQPWAFRKAYQQAMTKFVGSLRDRCRFAGVDHLLLRTDADPGEALAFYLHQRQRVSEAGKRSAPATARAAGGDSP